MESPQRQRGASIPIAARKRTREHGGVSLAGCVIAHAYGRTSGSPDGTEEVWLQACTAKPSTYVVLQERQRALARGSPPARRRNRAGRS
jgi:hypothetical protein